MKLTSSAFSNGNTVPKKYTEDGANVSVPLEWEDIPDTAQEFALLMEDPDAPGDSPWVHWIMCNIPKDVDRLPEGIERTTSVDGVDGAVQGMNSWPRDNVGYRGPAPPRGHSIHHYHFKLYALDAPLKLPGGVAKDELIKAMQGHVLAEAELVGQYER